jgi:hypothetical protein
MTKILDLNNDYTSVTDPDPVLALLVYRVNTVLQMLKILKKPMLLNFLLTEPALRLF